MRRLSGYLVLLLLAVGAQAGEWRVDREYRRPIEGGGAADTVIFSLYSGGHSASDTLVVDEKGTILPSRVLHSDRNGQTWVAYQGSKANGSVMAYYGGGAGGGGSAGSWKPQLSLILMTMPIPSGALQSHKPIASAAQSGPLYGLGFVDKIWHAVNPYGPDSSFASAYIGYLKIDKPGRYRIFTASAEASFVFLDGQELASWPGHHEAGGGGYGKYGKEVHLDAGLHRIEYYHAKLQGAPCMALGWQTPSDKSYKPVPESAFFHTPMATAGAPERRGGGPLAACEWEEADQLLYADEQYTRVRFIAQGQSVPPKAKVVWDYGDGVRALGLESNDHIYLGDGPFPCVLRIVAEDGKTLDQFNTLVRIKTEEKNLTILDEQPVKDYVDDIAQCEYSKASEATMRALWTLVETQDNVEKVRPFCESYVERFGTQGTAWHAADRLALALSVKEPERAAKLYARLVGGSPTPLDSARVRAEQIELVLYRLKDPQRALSIAQTTREMRSGLEARLAAVKIGDIARAQGDLEKAEDAYRQAQKVAYSHMDRRVVAVRQGGFLETVASHVEHGHLRAAREALVLWEIEYPEGKFSGDLILMTARYFEAVGDYPRALEELLTLTKINPLSPYLPEIEFRMARCYARMGNVAKARELRDKVMQEYPKSRAAREVQQENF